MFKLLGLICLIVVLGCTRASSEKMKVGFSLPSVKSENGSQSISVLAHVIINVSGAGMTTFLKTWDLHDSGGAATGPTEFAFEFDTGTQRLVQAFAVYQDSDTKQMSFYYGDLTTDFTGSNLELNIPINRLTDYSASGKISGRYFTSDSGGPSGPVKISYKPANKPPMIIKYGFIYNGWFNLFGLSDIALEYTLADGSLLFGGPTSLNNLNIFPVNSPQSVKLQFPLSKMTYTSGSSSVTEVVEPQYQIYGWFFGAGVSATVQSAKKVCFDSIAGTISGNVHSFRSTGTPLTLTRQSTLSATSSLFDVTNSTGLGYLGSVLYTGGDTASCSTQVEYSDKLTLTQKTFDESMGDLSPVMAPFRIYDTTNGRPFTITWPTISGQLLPGVQDSFDTLEFYLIPSAVMASALANTESNQLDCESIRTLGKISVTALNAVNSSFTADFTPIQSSVANDSGFGVGICFAKGAGFAGAGRLIRNISNSGSGGGNNSSSKYLRVEVGNALSSNNGSYIIKQNMCYPVQLKLFQGSGTTYTASSLVTVSGLTSGGSNSLTFYSDASCTTGSTSSIGIAVGYTGTLANSLFIKGTQAGTALQLSQLSVSGDSVGFSASTNLIDVVDRELQFSIPSQVVAETCYGGEIKRVDASGAPAPDATAVAISYSGAADFEIYNTLANCDSSSSVLTSIIIPRSQAGATVYLKKKSSASTSSLTLTPSIATYSPLILQIATASGSSLAHRLIFDFLNSPLQLGICNPILLRNVNSNDVEVPLQAGENFRLVSNSLNVSFYSGSDCSSANKVDSVSMIAGQSRAKIFILSSDSANSIFQLVAESTTNAVNTLGQSGDVSVSLPVQGQPYLVFTRPLIKSALLGSHDFPFNINLTSSSNSSVFCEETVSPYTSYQTCSSALSSPSLFVWSSSDAIAKKRFRLTVTNSAGSRSYFFEPDKDYTLQPLVPFEVVLCDQVLNPADVTTYSSIQTHFSTNASSKVCLNAGVFAPGSQGGANIVLNGGALIGSIDKLTGLPATRFQSLPNIITLNIQVGKYANLDLYPASSGAISLYLVKNIGSNTNIMSSNNIYRLNQYHSIGFYSAMANANVDFLNDLFFIDGAATSAKGIDIENCTQCGSFYVTDTGYIVDTAVASGDSVIGLYLFKANAVLYYENIRNYDFSMTRGSWLVVDDSGTQLASQVEISGLKTNHYGTSPLITLSGPGAVNITNSKLGNNGSNYLINSMQTSLQSMTISLLNSSLFTTVDKSLINFGYTGQVLNSKNTDFIRVGASDSGQMASAVQTAGSQLNWTFEKDLKSQSLTTRFCNLDSAHRFQDFVANAATLSGLVITGSSWASPSMGIANVDEVQMKCRY